MIRALALLLALAGPAMAEGGPSEDSIARLVQAIAAAGCTVDETNQAAVLAAAKMDETEAGVIVGQLVDESRAVFEGAGLRLTTEGCKP